MITQENVNPCCLMRIELSVNVIRNHVNYSKRQHLYENLLFMVSDTGLTDLFDRSRPFLCSIVRQA